MARPKTKPKRKGPEWRAMVVAEALAGSTREVAKARGVAVRTLTRWIAATRDGGPLAARVQRKSLAIEADWAEDAKRAARHILAALETLIDRALAEEGPVAEKRIHEVAGALKIVGELGIAKQAFPAAQPAPVKDDKSGETSGQPGADREGAPAPEARVVPIRGLRSAAAE